MPSISWAQAISLAKNATPPAPAAAAGYKFQTLGGGVWIGVPWVPFDLDGTHPAALKMKDHKDGSVTLAGGGNGYNAHLGTVHSGGLDGWTGVAYGGGGYFEATLSIAGDTYQGYGVRGSDGWPAWWAYTIELARGKVAAGYEPDFMEFFSPTHYTGSIHKWGDPSLGKNGELAAAVLPEMDLPAGTSWSEPHRYGFLWVPATNTTQGHAQWYLDGKEIPGVRVTWGKGDGSPYTDLDNQHLYLLLGTGTGNPMTVFDVQVWQKDGSGNISSFDKPALVGSAGAPADGTGWRPPVRRRK